MQDTSSSPRPIIMIIRGIIISVLIMLASILLFALIIKIAVLPESVIKPVNQFIKVLSIFLGCFFSLKGGMGLIKGIALGVVSTAITYILFLFIGGELYFTQFLLDLLFGLIVGGLSGIITVNVRK